MSVILSFLCIILIGFLIIIGTGALCDKDKFVGFILICIACILTYFSIQMSLYYVAHWSVPISIVLWGLLEMSDSGKIKGFIYIVIAFALWSSSTDAESDCKQDKYESLNTKTDFYDINDSDSAIFEIIEDESYDSDTASCEISEDDYLDNGNPSSYDEGPINYDYDDIYNNYNTSGKMYSLPYDNNNYDNSNLNKYDRTPCRACRNTGRCVPCGGTGKTKSKKIYHEDWSTELVEEDHRMCGGTGWCSACKGDGYLDPGD